MNCHLLTHSTCNDCLYLLIHPSSSLSSFFVCAISSDKLAILHLSLKIKYSLLPHIFIVASFNTTRGWTRWWWRMFFSDRRHCSCSSVDFTPVNGMLGRSLRRLWRERQMKWSMHHHGVLVLLKCLWWLESGVDWTWWEQFELMGVEHFCQKTDNR